MFTTFLAYVKQKEADQEISDRSNLGVKSRSKTSDEKALL